MVKADLSPEVIITKIRTSRCHFDTTPSVLAELKQSGVPNDVLLAMINAPYGAPRPEPTPVDLTPKAKQRQSAEEQENSGDGLKISYDKFKNHLSVNIYPRLTNYGSEQEIEPSGHYRVTFDAGYFVDGNYLKKPDHVVLVLYTTDSDCSRESSRQASFLLDDHTKIRLDTYDIDLTRIGDELMRSLGFIVSPKFFTQLANANKVEYQFCDESYRLTDTGVKRLRALASSWAK